MFDENVPIKWPHRERGRKLVPWGWADVIKRYLPRIAIDKTGFASMRVETLAELLADMWAEGKED